MASVSQSSSWTLTIPCHDPGSWMVGPSWDIPQGGRWTPSYSSHSIVMVPSFSKRLLLFICTKQTSRGLWSSIGMQNPTSTKHRCFSVCPWKSWSLTNQEKLWKTVYSIKLTTGNLPKQAGNFGSRRFPRKLGPLFGCCATGPQMIHMAWSLGTRAQWMAGVRAAPGV